MRIDPRVAIPRQGQAVSLDTQAAPYLRPIETPRDHIKILKGKPSRLRIQDLRDRLELSPAWQRKLLEEVEDPRSLDDLLQRLDGALEALQKRGLDKQPEYQQILKFRDRMRQKQRENDDPGTLFEEVMKWVLTPPGFETRLNQQKAKAVSLLNHQRYDAAGRLFRRVLKFQPGDPVACEGLGRCLYAEGRLTEARDALSQALGNTKRSDLLMLLGKISHQLGDRAYAKDVFTQAIAADPTQSESFSWLGVLSYEEGDLSSSMRFLQQSIALDPLSAVARFYLAQISLQQNDLLRANFQLDVVKRLDPMMDIPNLDPSKALAASTQDTFYEPYRWVLPLSSAC